MYMVYAGKQETGTKLAEFCAHAVLALEVLIHPKALPLEDFPTANHISDGIQHGFPETTYSGLKHRTAFSGGMEGMVHDDPDQDHDDLYDSWLENGKETEAPVSSPRNTIKDNEEPSEFTTCRPDKKLCVDGSFVKEIPVGSAKEPASITEMASSGNREDTMVEAHPVQESITQFQDSVSAKVSPVPATLGGSLSTEIAPDRAASDRGVLDQTSSDRVSSLNVSLAKGDAFTTADGGTSKTSILDNSMAPASKIDHDSDSGSDSFPDIVDGDPDSDYE